MFPSRSITLRNKSYVRVEFDVGGNCLTSITELGGKTFCFVDLRPFGICFKCLRIFAYFFLKYLLTILIASPRQVVKKLFLMAFIQPYVVGLHHDT